MALKETLTPLKATNNATYKTVEGVTYFKLKSEFEGDYTKHCGLLGEEIDENFYFLRGYDIEDIIVDENRNLIIKRVDKNYAPIIVNIGEELEQPKFDFDKNTGIVTVYYPDGTKSEMEGFLVEGKDIRIATDSTFNGNGTVYNPLRLSPVEKTGTFSPANEYFDLTNVDNMSQMPEGKGKGYRIVTKEKIDNFGCLYPFSAVKKIQKELEESGSQWRVPSKKDWDELLNALECAEDRNHSAITCTWLGKVAGSGLKSAKLWNDFQTLPTEIPTNGQDVCGLSVYPVGITPDRNAIINDKNYDAEGFGQIAGMWTTTVNDEGNAYVKVFGYNSTKVDQDTYGDGARMSIRLVKEYNSYNFNKIENILGFPYPTELVYGIHDDYQYVKIWTKINLYSDAESLGGIRSEEWASVTDSDKGVKTVYFINEWDGTDWHKKLMNDGDSVIIINYEDKPYHEWRIINGELVDTVEAIVEEVKKDIYNLSATTNELVTFCGWTVNTINEFSTATEEYINRIDENVNTEINNRKESDEKLLESIRKESELRDSVDKQLRESIIAEGEQRKKSDDEILLALQQETENRASVDGQLNDAIKSETNRAIEAEKALQNNINKEQERVETVKNNLQEQIINNIATISIIEPSSANVLEEFVLKNNNGKKLGESIKIYKDSSLVGATIGFKGASTVNKDADGNFILVYSESERDENIKYLYLIYKGENGELKLVGIDFENFLLEAEFGSGLKILEHVVSIKVKDGDKYLNVDADGLYSINIDESIASATTIINDKIDAKIIALSGEVNTFINKVSDNEVKNTKLENRVKELENKLTNLEGTIKDIIKSYIVGTEKEIKVFENENKLKIGFDDNAIFGNIPNI